MSIPGGCHVLNDNANRISEAVVREIRETSEPDAERRIEQVFANLQTFAVACARNCGSPESCVFEQPPDSGGVRSAMEEKYYAIRDPGVSLA